MGIQIPNIELVVSSHYCIVYFFHSSSLNYNLLCWQSRSLFKINEHDALPNPIWVFHSYCWISEPDPTSFMSALKKYILKLSGLGFLFFFWLVGCFCHRPYSFFSLCRYRHLSSQSFLSAGRDKMKIPRSRTEFSSNGSTRGTDVHVTTALEEVRNT